MKLISLFFIVGVMVSEPLTILMSTSYGGRSHIKSIFEITKELEGHRLIFAGLEDTLPFADGYNVTTISLGSPGILKEVAYKKIIEPFKQYRGNELNVQFWEVLKEVIVNLYSIEIVLLKQVVNKVQPHLMICDYLATACRDLAQHYGIPLIIGLQTIDGFEPALSSFITNSQGYGPITTHNLSLLQRFRYKVMAGFDNVKLFKPLLDNINQVRIEFKLLPGPLIDFNYGLTLANSFFGFEASRYLPPHFKLIGPILDEHPTEKLSIELLSFLNHHHRVLYIGFGSHIQLNQIEIELILKSCLFSLNQRLIDGVIWGLGRTKINNNLLIKHHQIKFLNWAPQASLLLHPNVRLFLSHGGIESIFESLNGQTPLIILPFYGDQLRNARKLQDMQVGYFLDPITKSQFSLQHAINHTLNSPRISINLAKYHNIIHLIPNRRLVAANLIISHAKLARHCRQFNHYQTNTVPCELQHLVPVDHQMSFITSSMLDWYIFGALILLTLLCLFLFTTRYLLVQLKTILYSHPSKPKQH